MYEKILIVGGSSGLGKRLAEIYASDGCKVIIAARREELLKNIQQEFPNNISILKADITDNNIGSILTSAIHKHNGIDLCIITASTADFNPDLNIAVEIETINTNVVGYANVLTAVWHYFKKKGFGHIAGITSVAAARGNKVVPAYHAGKAFQSVYLESLRIKAAYEKNKIIISELIPGYVDTVMGKGDRLFWMVSLDKAATQIKRAIKNKKNKAFISKRWWIVYKIFRYLPFFIYVRLVNSKISLKKR